METTKLLVTSHTDFNEINFRQSVHSLDYFDLEVLNIDDILEVLEAHRLDFIKIRNCKVIRINQVFPNFIETGKSEKEENATKVELSGYHENEMHRKIKISILLQEV